MEDIAEQNLKVVLDKALAEGTISEEQYRKMLAETVPERRDLGRDRMQTILITAGVTLIAFVAGFSILIAWHDMSYNAKVALLWVLTASMFIGAVLAKKIEYDKLHFGLLTGASNLFALGYGYWFYYELHVHEANGGYTGWEDIVPADRILALGIPLIVVPVMILCYLIYRNSRLGSQGALLSLLIGCEVFFARAMDDSSSSDPGFWAIGLIGLAILISAIVINIQWRLGRWASWKKNYIERLRTFNSLISSGFVLGSIYILIAPTLLNNDYNELTNGAIWMTFPALLAIFYGVETRKEGLVLSACGVIIISTWIAGLSLGGGGVCILPLAIMTALMLIGIAFILRRISKEEDMIKTPSPEIQPAEIPKENGKDG